MVDRFQLLFEDVFHCRYVFESDGTFLEITFLYLGIDYFVYQIADACLRIFGQAA